MHIIRPDTIFEWDPKKEAENIIKHGFSFREASEVFKYPDVAFLEDLKHSLEEIRYFAVGKIQRGVVLTVRCAVKGQVIRIFGAANWRKWRRFYEERKNSRSL